jgi:hypothetical protein
MKPTRLACEHFTQLDDLTRHRDIDISIITPLLAGLGECIFNGFISHCTAERTDTFAFGIKNFHMEPAARTSTERTIQSPITTEAFYIRMLGPRRRARAMMTCCPLLTSVATGPVVDKTLFEELVGPRTGRLEWRSYLAIRRRCRKNRSTARLQSTKHTVLTLVQTTPHRFVK